MKIALAGLLLTLTITSIHSHADFYEKAREDAAKEAQLKNNVSCNGVAVTACFGVGAASHHEVNSPNPAIRAATQSACADAVQICASNSQGKQCVVDAAVKITSSGWSHMKQVIATCLARPQSEYKGPPVNAD